MPSSSRGLRCCARGNEGSLRSRSRAAPIGHLALAERAQNYLAQGKKGMARKDLECILAEDSSYEGVREHLADLSDG